MRHPWLYVVILATFGCAGTGEGQRSTATVDVPAAPPVGAPTPAPPSQNALKPATVIAATYVDHWWGKPPLEYHYFDVVLHNPANGPRWLVLPNTFPYEGDTVPAPGRGKLIELQAFRLGEAPRVVIAKAVGGCFWAVRLPARGHVTLRRLPISSWWERVPDSTVIEVIVAREVLLGSVPLATCIEEEPSSQSGADVLAPRDAADPRALDFWHPAEQSGVPVAFTEESRARVTVRLDPGIGRRTPTR